MGMPVVDWQLTGDDGGGTPMPCNLLIESAICELHEPMVEEPCSQYQEDCTGADWEQCPPEIRLHPTTDIRAEINDPRCIQCHQHVRQWVAKINDRSCLRDGFDLRQSS